MTRLEFLQQQERVDDIEVIIRNGLENISREKCRRLLAECEEMLRRLDEEGVDGLKL